MDIYFEYFKMVSFVVRYFVLLKSEEDGRGDTANDNENPTEEILTEEESVKPPLRDRRKKKGEPTALSDVATGTADAVTRTGDAVVGTDDRTAAEANETRGGEPETKEPLIDALPKKKSLFGKLYSPLKRKVRKLPEKNSNVADNQSDEG